MNPRIDPSIQLNKDFYKLRKDITEFEIGHMAANDAMAWGKNANDAQIKAYQTFHFPNSVPQAEKLNTGLWRSLESYIIKEAGTVKKNKRISVFTRPLLLPSDPGYIKDHSFQIPLLFYKVIIFMGSGKLYLEIPPFRLTSSTWIQILLEGCRADQGSFRQTSNWKDLKNWGLK